MNNTVFTSDRTNGATIEYNEMRFPGIKCIEVKGPDICGNYIYTLVNKHDDASVIFVTKTALSICQYENPLKKTYPDYDNSNEFELK